MSEETKTAPAPKKPEPPPQFVPRRLKVVMGTSRGNYLADADTGEDLRLGTMSFIAQPHGIQKVVHLSVLVDQFEAFEAPKK